MNIDEIIMNIDEIIRVVNRAGYSFNDIAPPKTLITCDNVECEIIDGYDAVPLSESEYSDMPFNTSWSMNNV